MTSSRDAVAEIAGALRRQTREQRDYLIVMSDPKRNYYVQFPHPGAESRDVLYCEAVSDEWLDSANELGEAGASRLRALGWSDPEANSPNWSREFLLQGGADFEQIAATLVETLSDVYGYDGGPLDLQIAD